MLSRLIPGAILGRRVISAGVTASRKRAIERHRLTDAHLRGILIVDESTQCMGTQAEGRSWTATEAAGIHH